MTVTVLADGKATLACSGPWLTPQQYRRDAHVCTAGPAFCSEWTSCSQCVVAGLGSGRRAGVAVGTGPDCLWCAKDRACVPPGPQGSTKVCCGSIARLDVWHCVLWLGFLW